MPPVLTALLIIVHTSCHEAHETARQVIVCRASGEKLDLDAERRIRTPEEMAAEAAELAFYFVESSDAGQ